MPRCRGDGCQERVSLPHVIWVGQQLEWAQRGGWLRPLCPRHEVMVPVEFVLTAQSRQAATAWATPITFATERPDDPGATTSLRDLADLQAQNPDLVHGSAGLTGADVTIHAVRDGLRAMGVEMMRAEKLKERDLAATKGEDQ